MDRPPLPEGEVAFVFTDVQGSTRLLERFPSDYGRLLARHHEILGDAVAQHGGVVFETVGDAVYAAFVDPVEAVRATIGAQRALGAEDWSPMDPIRVRIGVHSGLVETRGSHYFGPALYRCARLMATAHGGQVVVSEAVADRIAGEFGLLDLGSHRLKDLQQPERVFQVVADGLESEFPPLRSAGGRPNNLPTDVKTFLGRERELTDLLELLISGDARVVTLTGPGGSGKTRLALRASEALLEPFTDGVFFVDLAPLRDADLVVAAIADVLRVQPAPGRALLDSLITHLAALDVLLVLDNFEHLGGAAPSVGAIVAAAPRVRVLVTSRVPLGIQAEREVLVPPLRLPAAEAGDDEILESPAVRLFTSRAREIRADFDADAQTVAEICRRVDGLPLAIELAAARTRVLPAAMLLERLEHRLALLTEGAVDLPERQRTLRATIEWSYDLLDEAERKAFCRLAVFRGGCTLDAADAVIGEDALARLSSLTRHALVVTEWNELGEPRFHLLETVAEFAREQLGEVDAATRAHAEYFADRAEEIESHLYTDERLPWLQHLADDRDNYRAALTWALAHDEAGVGMRIMCALWLWWWTAFREARVWAERLLDLPTAEEPTRLSAGTAFVAELGAAGEGDLAALPALAERAVALSGAVGDDRWFAFAQSVGAGMLAGLIESGDVDIPRMRELCDEAIAAGRRSGDAWTEAWATMISALIALLSGAPDLARTWGEDGVAKFRALDDSWSAATGSATVAFALIQLGELTEAEHALAGTVDALVAVGDYRIASNATLAHGLIARFSGDMAAAGRHYASALELCARCGDPANVPVCLEGMAAAAVADDPERALRLLGAARALYEDGYMPGVPGFEPMYGTTLEVATAMVGAHTAETALAGGAADARRLPLLDLLDERVTSSSRA